MRRSHSDVGTVGLANLKFAKLLRDELCEALGRPLDVRARSPTLPNSPSRMTMPASERLLDRKASACELKRRRREHSLGGGAVPSRAAVDHATDRLPSMRLAVLASKTPLSCDKKKVVLEERDNSDNSPAAMAYGL
eukprot:6638279-Prymnesium_polylepis.2